MKIGDEDKFNIGNGVKILGMGCFCFKLDYSRFLFDRGKCAGRLLLRLLRHFGYESNFSFVQSFQILCVIDSKVYDARKLFVHIAKTNRILLLIWIRVYELEMIQEFLGRLPYGVWWSLAEKKYKLHNLLFVFAQGFHVKLLVVIIDRQSDVLRIPLGKFKNLLLLIVFHVQRLWILIIFSRWECMIFSGNSWSARDVNWTVWGCILFVCWDTNCYYPQLAETRIRNHSLVFLKDGTTCAGSQAEPRLVLLEVAQGLPTAEIPQPPTYCLNQMLVLHKVGSSRYFLFCSTYKWGLVCQTSKDDICTRTSERRLRTQVLLMGLRSVTVWVCIEYLKWKFKLFPTGWCSDMFCAAGIRNQLVANCLLMGRLHQSAFTNGSTLISFLMKFLVSIFLILHICVKLYNAVFEQHSLDLLVGLHIQVIKHWGHEEWGSFKLTQLADEAVRAVQVNGVVQQVELYTFGSRPYSIRILLKLVKVHYLSWIFRFYYQPLMMLPSFFISCSQFFTKGLSLHYRLLAYVLYGAFTFLRKAEMMWYLEFHLVQVYIQLEFDKCNMVSFRDRYTPHWNFMLIHCVLVGMSTPFYTKVFTHHNFDFWITTKYCTPCQHGRANDRKGEAATNGNLQVTYLVVRGVIVPHRKTFQTTNLASTEDFCTSADMSATFLEQPASQLVGSNDAKTPIHLGEFSTSMAAQIFLREILILYVWMWVDYLCWKFKFPSTSLWRMGLGMDVTTERVVLGVWFRTYYELRNHLKLEARSGIDGITADGYNPRELQLNLEQLNVSEKRGTIVQVKEKIVSSILSTNALPSMLCSQLHEWSMDDSAVFYIGILPVHTDANMMIQVHASTSYGEGVPMLTVATLSVAELFFKLVPHQISYYVQGCCCCNSN